VIDVHTEVEVDLPRSEVARLRERARQCNELVQEHQVGRVEDIAPARRRFQGRVRRGVPRQADRIHLRGKGVDARSAARDERFIRPVSDRDDLHLGRHARRHSWLSRCDVPPDAICNASRKSLKAKARGPATLAPRSGEGPGIDRCSCRCQARTMFVTVLSGSGSW
jgi:hypothetical protein